MSDPYAPSQPRQQLTVAEQARHDASYVRDAANFVQDAVRFIEKKRDWIINTCDSLAAVVDDRPKVDPVVGGLLDHMPRSGSVWPEAERKQWLALLEGSFKLIYKDAASP